MANKLITTDQLNRVATWIRNTFAQKNTDASFSSVTINGLKLSTINGCLMVEDTSGLKGSALIVLPDAGEVYDVVLNGQKEEVVLPNLYVDSIACGESGSHTAYYSLPTSSQDAKSKSSDLQRNGGCGTVLTTRYKLGERVFRDVPASMSLMIQPSVYTVLNITATENDPRVSINLDMENSDSGFLTEYWVELNNANRCGGINLVGYNNPVWSPNEPEWGGLPCDRLLIHIINGIAVWHLVPVANSDEQS